MEISRIRHCRFTPAQRPQPVVSVPRFVSGILPCRLLHLSEPVADIEIDRLALAFPPDQLDDVVAPVADVHGALRSSLPAGIALAGGVGVLCLNAIELIGRAFEDDSCLDGQTRLAHRSVVAAILIAAVLHCAAAHGNVVSGRPNRTATPETRGMHASDRFPYVREPPSQSRRVTRLSPPASAGRSRSGP